MKPENVKQHIQMLLDGDVALKKDIGRNLINIRGLAKFLIKTNKLDVSLDSVISAIRRYQEHLPKTKEDNQAQQLLREAKMNFKTKMALLTLKRADEVKTALGRPDKIIDYARHDSIRLLEGATTYQLILDRKNLERVSQQFPKRNLLYTDAKVGMIELSYPPNLVTTPGVFSLIIAELAQHNISVATSLIGTQEHILVVSDENVIKSAELIYNLTEH
jgi:hypothetical protein